MTESIHRDTEEIKLEEMTMEEIMAAGKPKVSAEVWEWVNGGTERELTMQCNRLALEGIRLRLRVLHGLETVNTGLTILGQKVETPIMAAPFANMGRLHPEAEMAIAKGAEKAGAMMFLGPSPAHSVEQLAGAVRTPIAWNGEPLKDRETLARRMEQAEKEGCRAVGLCLDDFRGIKIKDRLRPLANRSLSLEELGDLRKRTSLPFFVKGIMTVEDALAALEAGIEALIVSNHGGRVLDGCQASIEVLPEIVDAVGGRAEVLVDGGFRRGADVLKALALGAKGVLVGRPVCWGLAAGGAEGVARVLRLLTDELIRTMLLTNVPDVNHVPRDIVV